MHFIIMGCGRVGGELATTLDSQGHSVAVIDQDSGAFRRLPSEYSGQKVTGVGFDRDVLIQAGVEEAYGFAAVSSGDNSNILAARVVRETFGVQNVVTRIYDPARAEVYQRLGIPTVATVSWAATQILRELVPIGSTPDYIEPSGQIAVARIDYDDGWIGMPIAQLQERLGARVAFLTRQGAGQLPAPTSVLQEQDQLHLVAPVSALDQLGRILGHAPKPEEDN